MTLEIYLLSVILIILLGVLIFITIHYTKYQYKNPINTADALLSNEELLKHALELARGHRSSYKKRGFSSLITRLNENYKFIQRVYREVIEDAGNKLPLCPASEWLLDNFYVIEEEIKALGLSLSPGFFKDLKYLDNGYLRNYPRIFAIALEMISHQDSKIEEDKLISFINSYQEDSYLAMPELWALSSMFTIALIEKLRKICEEIAKIQRQWKAVEGLRGKDYKEIFSTCSSRIKAMKNIEYSYIEHLLRFFKKDGLSQDALMAALNEKLLENDMDIEYVINREHQEQAILQISIGNSISSLHLIKALDWERIFESLSIVEEILREDPSRIYCEQDFESRNYYRRKIETLSRKLDISEPRIARNAIACARLAHENNNEFSSTHVGYYLAGPGRATLLSRFTGKNKVTADRSSAFSLYLFFVIAFSCALALSLGCYSYLAGGNIFLGFLAFFVVLIPSSEIVINLVNWLSARLVSSTFLPKLELRSGIGVENRTIVIVPTILPNLKRLETLMGQLEVTYLANHEDNIYFALVGDYKDGDYENTPEDMELMEAGLRLTRELNSKYRKGEDVFYFFLRRRTFSSSQNKWMGWERKRGAIVEFNNLIRGSENTSYSVVSGDLEPLRRVKYVITLDADTIMTIGTAKKLIGTIAHPLNSSVFDEKQKLVKRGYGLLQPSISVNIESSSKSLFTRIFAGNGGVDTYSAAAFDLYQDLFGEGIFTGKGIYDVEMFIKSLNTAIPENMVLSHDLLEGSYLRVGLVSDIELIDGYPEKYSSYMMRLHRWVRGDWQLIRWLYPRILNREGVMIKNPLSLLSRWKIFDNLRRSLVYVFILLLILLGNTLLPGNNLVWLGFSLITFVFPLVIGLLNYLSAKHEGLQRRRTNGNLIIGFKAGLLQTFVNFLFLPYFCYTMLNAVFKTLYRVYISKKNMLEWVTAADAEKNSRNDLMGYMSRMVPSTLILLLPAIYVLLFREDAVISTAALLIIWGISPFIAYYISQPDENTSIVPPEEDIRLLRRVARKTWAFYEEFSGDENNYLPVDNFQELPIKRTAHRTSPTNIGFLLVSILSAEDFGYLTNKEMLELVDKTLSTIERLDKWRGHLFNWYDTKSLKVLCPRYVSTVDSGNLVGYYITLREGLLGHLNKPLLRKELVDGLIDTIELFDKNAEEHIISIGQMLSHGELNINNWYDLLISLKNIYEDQREGNARILSHINSQLTEFTTLFPTWLLKSKYLQEGIKDSLGNLEWLTSKLNELTLNTLEREYIWLLNKLEDSSKHKEDSKLYAIYLELKEVKERLEDRKDRIMKLVEVIDSLSRATEFSPLYDTSRKIFSIGYNVEKDKLTNSYYDLFASEARITSFLGVVRREIPPSHWFKLGRTLTLVDGYKGLVSWTGTMFEYFMPPLIMKQYPNTLLSETYKTALRAQRKYGKLRNLPWGTSESGYYTFDLDLNYQYKAFGVPELGLKRGLVSDMVVSPYSTVLAMPFEPIKSIENLKRLIDIDLEGSYGFYEAADFTPNRLNPKDKNPYVIVKSYMAHHQGMIFTALNNYLHNNILVKRFHSNPMIRAGEFLLQEKIPLKVIITKEHKEDVKPFERIEYKEIQSLRRAGLFDSKNPVCHLLSNGSYTVLLNNSGSGYSKREDIFLTRWREDLTSRGSGMFIFIRDLTKGKSWSAAYEPLMIKPDHYEAVFSLDKGEFIRHDGEINTHTEICVSPEDNCEIRKITLLNNSSEARLIECTSYLELVIAPIMSDIAHPAFSNLFVRTELLKEYSTLIASRRPRVEDSDTIWSFHALSAEGEFSGNIEYETDRYKFLGRGRTPKNPYALYHPLSNTTGSVLDPIMSLRGRIIVPPGKSVVLCYTSGICKSREEAVAAAKKYSESGNLNRAFELAYMRSQMETKYLNLKAADIENFDDMLAHILYLNPKRRDYKEILENNQLGQQNLWPYGISGDVPIVLITIKESKDINIVAYMLKAHEYWHSKGLKVDLIILNEEEGSYLQPLRDLIQEVVYSSHGRDIIDKMGGVFIRNTSTMPPEDKILLYSSSRLIINAELGKVGKQVKSKQQEGVLYFTRKEIEDIEVNEAPVDYETSYLFFNSYGGFDEKNREYSILLREGVATPLPWSNIVCNERFGFLITEGGSGHTWNQNSRENKLTPWSNDPVSDPPGEIIYIFDKDSRELWTITPLPIREREDYRIRHGAGYSIFEHNSHEIEQSLTMFVPKEENLKLSLIRLKNKGNTKRRLSVYYYIRPVLGVTDQLSSMHIVSSEFKGGILFENGYNKDYPGNLAFIGTSLKVADFTGDRLEFLGVYGDISSPTSIQERKLSGNLGPGFDPCGVLHSSIEIAPQSELSFVMLLGQGENHDAVNSLLLKYRNVSAAATALMEIKTHWQNILGTLQVKTPDLSMDLMLNNYLLYQNIACRIFARSAFYQSGGAYGFRDQLQDVLGVMHVLPELARNQIILHCGHQFIEGDVLHWWHSGAVERGIRTRFSDDLVWLPYVTAEYIEKTGDISLLYEEVNFLEDAPLREGEDERYGIPKVSMERANVYEHCIRAIERALKFGDHGIPLMGSGDWNDGMNTVGNKGRGESTWLGWFLYSTLQKFSPVCKIMEDTVHSEKYVHISGEIVDNIEKNAWDGEWYRRAYFDDGTPLGSSLNSECRIDSLAQSWAAISGGGNRDRVLTSMKALEDYLVDRENGLILLFTPPFDTGDLQPGYIKGYVPGVRENGGQYTHAATWVIYAYALLGNGNKAHELFHLINPINHTKTHMECLHYKAEPYVIAADVYTAPPHTGRGGWTWYTGSASWMYQTGLEAILGFKKKGSTLTLTPCIPTTWKEYTISYTYKSTPYTIKVLNPHSVSTGIQTLLLDGTPLPNNQIPLTNDHHPHTIVLTLASPPRRGVT